MATPDQLRNVELARGGLEAWTSGDVEATLASFTEDIEVFVPTGLMNSGTYRGRDEFLQWVEQWDEAWAEISYELEDLVPVGDRHVVATVRNRGQGRGSGVDVEDVRAWVLELRGDRSSYFSLQPNADEALAHARAREGAD
jgi:ketosteroid isomerase-like protein